MYYANDIRVSTYARREKEHENINPMMKQISTTSSIIQEGMRYDLGKLEIHMVIHKNVKVRKSWHHSGFFCR